MARGETSPSESRTFQDAGTGVGGKPLQRTEAEALSEWSLHPSHDGRGVHFIAGTGACPRRGSPAGAGICFGYEPVGKAGLCWREPDGSRVCPHCFRRVGGVRQHEYAGENDCKGRPMKTPSREKR